MWQLTCGPGGETLNREIGSLDSQAGDKSGDTLWAALPKYYNEVHILGCRQKIYEHAYTGRPDLAQLHGVLRIL